jgi:hypothetical protein
MLHLHSRSSCPARQPTHNPSVQAHGCEPISLSLLLPSALAAPSIRRGFTSTLPPILCPWLISAAAHSLIRRCCTLKTRWKHLGRWDITMYHHARFAKLFGLLSGSFARTILSLSSSILSPRAPPLARLASPLAFPSAPLALS